MKTSNKVLLILGFVLLATPLLFLSFFVKAHTEIYNPMGNENFEANAAGRISIPTRTFKGIDVKSSGINASFVYTIINSDKFGVKIPEGLKGVAMAMVNKNGELEITTNHIFKNHPYVNILIFAPRKTFIRFSKLKDETTVYTGSDSFFLSASDCKSTIYVRSRNPDTIRQSISLLAQKSNISIYMDNLNTLTIDASNSANVYQQNDDDDTLKVNTLQLNIQDRSTFSSKNLFANKIVGFIAENANLVGIDRSAVKRP